MIADHRPSPTPGRVAPRGISRAFVATVALVANCSSNPGVPPVVKVYEVTGRVLLADGKPLKEGRVYFVPKDGAMTSDATIGPEGGFSLSTGSSGDGAPPGNFKVRIEPGDPSMIAGRANAQGGKRLPFPAKYLDEDGSGLSVTVKAEPNRLEPFRLR